MINSITLEDSLENISAEKLDKKAVKGKKRNIMNILAHQDSNNSETYTELLPATTIQPTHTGYLFSATLLPFA